MKKQKLTFFINSETEYLKLIQHEPTFSRNPFEALNKLKSEEEEAFPAPEAISNGPRVSNFQNSSTNMSKEVEETHLFWKENNDPLATNNKNRERQSLEEWFLLQREVRRNS